MRGRQTEALLIQQETGHLSYECPKNALGERVPPAKKKNTKKRCLFIMETL